jgi:hypothetical protein
MKSSIARLAATAIDYPPMQAPATFNLDAVKKEIEETEIVITLPKFEANTSQVCEVKTSGLLCFFKFVVGCLQDVSTSLHVCWDWKTRIVSVSYNPYGGDLHSHSLFLRGFLSESFSDW